METHEPIALVAELAPDLDGSGSNGSNGSRRSAALCVVRSTRQAPRDGAVDEKRRHRLRALRREDDLTEPLGKDLHAAHVDEEHGVPSARESEPGQRGSRRAAAVHARGRRAPFRLRFCSVRVGIRSARTRDPSRGTPAQVAASANVDGPNAPEGIGGADARGRRPRSRLRRAQPLGCEPEQVGVAVVPRARGRDADEWDGRPGPARPTPLGQQCVNLLAVPGAARERGPELSRLTRLDVRRPRLVPAPRPRPPRPLCDGPIPAANGQSSRGETMWIVEHISVPCTARLRSSARVRSSRPKRSSIDHRRTYCEGAYCAWSPPTRSTARPIGSPSSGRAAAAGPGKPG